jgi:hypothetical protein
MSLKTENSRRVAKSRPVCMGLTFAWDLSVRRQTARGHEQTGNLKHYYLSPKAGSPSQEIKSRFMIFPKVFKMFCCVL